MSKPSTTNCPIAFCRARYFQMFSQESRLGPLWLACVENSHPILLGGYCGGVPPLPIPNREVKPTYADGTAMQCGRVGSRLLLEASITKVVGAFFLLRKAHFALFYRETRSARGSRSYINSSFSGNSGESGVSGI